VSGVLVVPVTPPKLAASGADWPARGATGGATNGQCLPSRFVADADWLIVLDDRSPDLETVIAHEVAHAYLGHSIADPLSDDETERQASEQTRSWGFTGLGSDMHRPS